MHKTMIMLGALLATTALPACAQPTPQAAPAPTPAATSATPADADPALWVVKDADTTIYLFGTVHVLKPGLSWFDDAVKTAFDGSKELVLEMVQPEPAVMQQVIVSKGMTAPTTPALTEQLPEAKRAAFAKAVADNGLPMAAVDRMKPWFAGITLATLPLGKLGYDPANGPETILTAAATKSGKAVAGLETFEQQIGFFDGLSAPAQMQFLTGTVDDLGEIGPVMANMVDVWAKGNPAALGDIMNDNLEDSPEVAKAILFDRNARWAEWIGTRMAKPGTVFIAVGAGHLAGKDSVQDYLAKKKLVATRVKY